MMGMWYKSPGSIEKIKRRCGARRPRNGKSIWKGFSVEHRRVVRVEGFEPPNDRVKLHYPMVSMAGFEPTHHGVKTHCLHHLTTWKYFAY